MKADLTRNTFHALQHFTRVIMQQGRVQLDSDWNEQAAILLQLLRTFGADLIGPHGGPEPVPGFQIGPKTGAPLDFTIGPGHYYVQGVLCQAEGIGITYLNQPDYPVPANQQLAAGKVYQIYLDAWERLVTYVEDDAIREVALGGADTAARAKLVWQVKQTNALAATACTSVQELTSTFQPQSRGMLKAVASQKGVSADPCVIAPDASYRGPENQLYRIEIHTGAVDSSGNKATPTFKWSRENGCVVYPIVSIATGGNTTTVTLENLGRDDRFGLNEGNWVEIQDDDYVLQNRAETLLQVQSIDTSTLSVTLLGTPDSKAGQDPSKHPLLRRWDHMGGDAAEGGLELGKDNAVLIIEGAGNQNWLAIEDGIEIQFQPPPPGTTNFYRTADYWLIPARTATGDIEWPTQTTTDSQGNQVTGPVAEPPDGVTHWYAPLAVINPNGTDPINPTKECRWQFPTQAVPIPSPNPSPAP
jgi:hypothetical protein